MRKLSSGLSAYHDATRTAETDGLGAEYHYDKTLSMRVGWDHYRAEVEVNDGGSKGFDTNVGTLGLIYNF